MTAAIDRAALDAQTFGDTSLAREILLMFRDQTPPLLLALAATSGGARAKVAHRIKGSALAIGAGDLAGRAATLESAPDDAEALRGVEEAAAAAQSDITIILSDYI
jgi:HPt (histidine-containing phosphotransfer) domain-containing protein